MELKANLFLFAGFFFAILGFIFISYFSTAGTQRIVFCDVGQGDGILVVSKSGKQALIDGGGGSKILDCLSKHMPFWDRELELMVATHDQKDHTESQIEVFRLYDVGTVITTGVKNNASFSNIWQESLNAENSKVHKPEAGEEIVVDDLIFEVLWPKKSSYIDWNVKNPSDLNETSVVLRLNWTDDEDKIHCAYLTGDITKEILVEIVDRKCEILKVSHHGSKTGTTDEIVSKISPKIAVIQVGKNNYGHPTEEVLSMFDDTEILRNDIFGDIQIWGDLSH